MTGSLHNRCLWHVYDVKISHVSKDVITSSINDLLEKYAKEALITSIRGKIHHCPGMSLDYTMYGKVQVKMNDYIDGILESLLVYMN